MPLIYHIIPRYAWQQAQAEGVYRGDTLEAEGFIHFSKLEQIEYVANQRFRGHTGLQLLVVDTSRLQHELRYEPPFEDYDGSERFPHLYGPLNLDAVVGVIDFEPNEDGTFTLPEGIA